MKKVLLNSPLLSSSGYGEMARLALSVLLEHQDEFDVYVNILNWGQTSWIYNNDEMFNTIQALRAKTDAYVSSRGGRPEFDISLQVTIPNEWKRMAPYNIGYTAGIETTLISPQWLEPTNMMDKVITISQFSKEIFLNTIFADQNGNQAKVITPIDVVGFYCEPRESKPLDLNLSTDFNFLAVSQLGPRKNVDFLIRNFIEEFKSENVGLVIKGNFANNSNVDRENVYKQIYYLVNEYQDRKCKVYFLHGQLDKSEMYSLYRNPKIKAYVTATHGEGFGIPILEATNAELPVIATDWSAHLEHLSMPDEQGNTKKMFAKVDYELKPIDQAHVWPGVMEPQSGWAFPTANSLKSRMREVYKDHGRFKSWAKKLAAYNNSVYSKQNIHEAFYKALKNDPIEDELIVL